MMVMFNLKRLNYSKLTDANCCRKQTLFGGETSLFTCLQAKLSKKMVSFGDPEKKCDSAQKGVLI